MLASLIPTLANLAGGLFSKKQKVPEYKAPKEVGLGDLPHYQTLQNFAENRISGKTAGFGDDFLDKSTSPAIAQLENSFQNKTMPKLSSELSKRGIARSAGPGLATDVIGQAERQKNLDVNQLISQFQVLNEQQKKRDITEGVNVATGSRAAAAGLAQMNNGNEQAANDFALSAYPLQQQQAVAGNLLGIETADPVLKQLIQKIQGGGSVSTKTLNSIDDNELNKMIMERQFAKRMGQ